VANKRTKRITQWAIAAWAEMRHSWHRESLLPWLWQHALIAWTLAVFFIGRACGSKPYPGWKRRLRACGRCPVFHRELMTCGKPGQQWFNPETEQMEQRGCLCPLRLKAQIPHAQCWSPADYWKDL
jgi:hypothetical protein